MSGDEQQPAETTAATGQQPARTTGTSEHGSPTAGPTEWRAGSDRARRWLTICLVPSALLLLLVPVLEVARNGWSPWVMARLCGILSPLILILVVVLPRTRATEDGLEMRRGLARPLLVPWSEVCDLTAEGGRWATAVTVHLTDGRRYPLPAVQPEQLDEVRAARARLAHHDPTGAAREG